jgi:hypothetical protein
MTDRPNMTVDTIKRAVSNAFHQVIAKDNYRKDAADVLQSAQKDAVGAREKLLVALAGAAAQHNWTGDEITDGVDAAVAAQNDKKNTSLNTFAAEVRKAMRPAVRGHVQALFDLATKAWDAEGELEKGDPKPLRKAFARKYHLVVGPLFDRALASDVPTEISELNEMAARKLREAELDAAKVFGRFKALREQLAAFQRDFPVENLDVVVEYLNDMTLDEFKKAVARETATLPEAAPAGEATQAPASDDAPVQGVSDVIDDVLGEMAGEAKLAGCLTYQPTHDEAGRRKPPGLVCATTVGVVYQPLQ